MLIRFGFRSHKMERGGGGRVRSGAGGKVGWILDDSEILFLFYLWNENISSKRNKKVPDQTFYLPPGRWAAAWI